MNGIPELRVVHGPDEEADGKDDISEGFAETFNLLFKRSWLFVFLGSKDLRVYISDSSLHACVGNNTDGISRADDGGSEEHVLLILKHLVFLNESDDALLDGDRLTSKGSLLDLESN